MIELELLEELARLEALLHRPSPDVTLAELEAKLAPGFTEVGASGKRFDRADALAVFAGRCGKTDLPTRVVTRESCRCLGGEVYLLSYRLQESGRDSLRSTVWRRSAQGWVAEFHQGTLIPPA